MTRADQQKVATALAALAKSGKTWVLATLRSDFYPLLAQLEDLTELREGFGQYDLKPPSPAEIGQLIRFPAAAAALRFEENHDTGEKPGRRPEAMPRSAIPRTCRCWNSRWKNCFNTGANAVC